MEMISSNLDGARNKQITADCDAFSILVIANPVDGKMDVDQKLAIKKFLFLFGTKWSAVSSSPTAIAGDKKSSIFGSSRNKCQHLKSSNIGTAIESSEAQVISTPVKIAINKSCREKIVSHLCDVHYPIQNSSNKDVCFDPQSNKPPYGVIVEAILDCSYVTELNKFIIHIADIGTRHKIECVDDGECPLQQLFHGVQTMRAKGVSVELTQIDLAFNIPTKNALVQWSYDRDHKQSGFVLNTATAEVWPLHTVVTDNGLVSPDRDQKGTVRLQQQKWDSPKPISMFSDNNEEDSYDSNDVEDNHRPWNNTLRKIYPSESMLDAKSIHHMKLYSGIVHILKQGQRLLPLTYLTMKDFHKISFSSLKNFWDHMRKISGESIKLVKRHGICARIEVSVRPGSHLYGDILRCRGHLIDILAHVQIAIRDLFCGMHKVRFKTIPYELVYPRTLSLIDQVESQTRFRASRRFCDLFQGEKYEEWLKAFVTLIMITAGLTGELKLKSVAKWLKDSKRYDPTNLAAKIQGNFLSLDNSDEAMIEAITRTPQQIPQNLLKILNKLLRDLKFTKTSRDCICDFLKLELSHKPSSHSRIWYQKLTLKDKLRLAQNIHTTVIANLFTMLHKKGDASTEERHQQPSGMTIPQMYPTTVDIADDSWDDRHLAQYTKYQHEDPLLFMPPTIRNSAFAMNQFQEHTCGKSYRKWHSSPPEDPTMLLIMRLLDLARFTDAQAPVFIIHLYHYIKMCHDKEIRLPMQRENLKRLDCNNIHHLTFCNASICLRDNSADVNSLHTICIGLGVKILGSGTHSGELLLASLSYHYYFPCSSRHSHSHPLDESLFEEDVLRPLNELLDETLQTEFVIELPCFTSRMTHFFRQSDNLHLYIAKRELVSSPTTSFDVTAGTTTEAAYDIHIVIDQCLNFHGIWGEDSRRNMSEFLSARACLCDDFLLEDARNNPNFLYSQTLSHLESQKSFVLMDGWNVPDEHYWNMCPDVIMPSLSLLHQCNIFYIDKDEQKSELHIFDKKSCKVITYLFPNMTTSPSIKCHVFWKQDASYKYTSFIQGRGTIPPNSNLFQGISKHVNAFKKHPQGEPLTANSIADSILKLLMSKHVNHEHFRSPHEENDILDIHPFLGELLTSDKTLEDLFNINIVCQLNQENIFSLQGLLSHVKKEETILSHIILCPILCLKYKLWICVWEDLSGKKSSYFYGFEPIKGVAVCETKSSYAYFEEQSHILYIKSSKSKNRSQAEGGFISGYWRQVLYNPYTHPHTTYNFSEILRCKFSYLDGPLRMKAIELFKKVLYMNIVTKVSCKHPIVQNGDCRPTIIPIEFHNSEKDLIQHAVFVCYSFEHATRTYSACLVHSEMNVNETRATLLDVLTQVGREHSSEYQLMTVSVHFKSDFASSFLAMLHMYIANKSSNMEKFQENLKKLSTVDELVNKTKAWIADLLGTFDVEAVRRPPQWLHQLIADKDDVQQPISNDAKRSDINKKTKKRLLSLTSSEGKNNLRRQKSSSSLTTFNQEQLIQRMTMLFGRNRFIEEGYKKFISTVEEKAGYNSTTKSFEECNESSDYVARFPVGNIPIQAKNLLSLYNMNWLNDEVINFMGAILQTQNENAMVFSSYFFTTLLTKKYDYNQVKNWWLKVSPAVRHLYIPIIVDNNHWIFLRLDFVSKRIQLWNSMDESTTTPNQTFLSAAEKYVKDVFLQISNMPNMEVQNKMWGGEWTFVDESVNSPKQTNGYDCGPFIILSMTIMIQGSNLTASSYSQEDLYKIKIRNLILKLIYQMKV